MATKKPMKAQMISVEFLVDYPEGNKKEGDKIEMPKGLFNHLAPENIVKEIKSVPKKESETPKKSK